MLGNILVLTLHLPVFTRPGTFFPVARLLYSSVRRRLLLKTVHVPTNILKGFFFFLFWYRLAKRNGGIWVGAGGDIAQYDDHTEGLDNRE